MSGLTIGLLVFALILLTTNIIPGVMNCGYIYSFKSGFTPMSNSYEGDSKVFQPEGYGMLGAYSYMNMVPSIKRQVNMGGLTYPEIRRKYPSKHDYQFIT
jgi:hypothetical protein